MSNNDKTVDLTGKATVKDEVVDLGKNATVDGETVIIKESEDGTITIEGDGIRVEMATCILTIRITKSKGKL